MQLLHIFKTRLDMRTTEKYLQILLLMFFKGREDCAFKTPPGTPKENVFINKVEHQGVIAIFFAKKAFLHSVNLNFCHNRRNILFIIFIIEFVIPNKSKG